MALKCIINPLKLIRYFTYNMYKVTSCTTRLQIKKSYVLPTVVSYVFCMDLEINTDFFASQNCLVFMTEKECVQNGTNLILKNNSSKFSFFKGVSWLRRLVAGLSPRRTGFYPQSVRPHDVCGGISGTGTGLLLVIRSSPSRSFDQYSTLIFIHMFLLPEVHIGIACEPSKKQRSFGKLESNGLKSVFTFFVFKGVNKDYDDDQNKWRGIKRRQYSEHIPDKHAQRNCRRRRFREQQTSWSNASFKFIHIQYTGCFTTLGHNCRRWFPRSFWSKKFI